MVVTRHSLPEVPQFLDLFVKKGSRTSSLTAPATYEPRLGFRSNRSVPRPLVWSSAKCPRTSGEGDEGHRVVSQDGFSYHRDPDQWLLPVSPSLRSNPILLSTDEQSAAVFQAGSVPTTYNPKWETLCLRVNNRQVVFVPHERYCEATGSESEGVSFRGTPQSCRWAYLLRTLALAPRGRIHVGLANRHLFRPAVRGGIGY